MLQYLIAVTEQIMPLVLVVGLIYAYLRVAYDRPPKLYFSLILTFSVLASCLVAYSKNKTNQFDIKIWNLVTFAVFVAAFIFFIILQILGKKRDKLGTIGSWITGGLMMVALYLYHLPPFTEFPYEAYLNDATLMSTNYLLSLVGMIFGIILTLVSALAIYKGASRLGKKGALRAMLFACLIMSVRYVGLAYSVLSAKRMIPSNKMLFNLSKFTNNYSSYFIYGFLLLGILVAIIILARSFREKEPYSNPAQRRKIIAKWRRRRRWAVTMITCTVASVLILTVGVSIDSQEVELSPIEESTVENGNVYVPLDRVSDGNLHRFAYKTENDVEIRFIVIQKPNSSSYGVGLDACEICGQTGYYQRGDQVVCNLCDVVMNINTIGFKGGCNPIVIDWSIVDGNIVVPVEGLLEYEKEFD
ncbi:MAG: Fe-S-containing protein [Eubacterium sp.]|nr:Fe-S-containing protein [Eubacterium sp.]